MLCVFSKAVEEDICNHGDSHTGNFVQLCNFVDMHDYMNQYFDPYEYPPPSTHIYNLPV